MIDGEKGRKRSGGGHSLFIGLSVGEISGLALAKFH